MEKPTVKDHKNPAPRFPRKVTAGKVKKTGRAKLRRSPHPAK